MKKKRSLGRELLKGAIAGAAATLIMDRLGRLLYEQQDRESRGEERAAQRGMTRYGMAAARATALVGPHLDAEQRERLGVAIHWALGVGTGALYAALRGGWESSPWAHTLGLSATFWGMVDQGMAPALGLAPSPDELPWQSHARGLAANVSYGVVAQSTLKLLDRVI